MKRILMFTERFSFGCNGDDLINSCNELMSNLSRQYCFYVLTPARNIRDKKNAGDIVLDKWIAQTESKGNKNVVRYVSRESLSAETITQIIKKINPHVIYINTMLSLRYSLLPLYVINKTGFAGKIMISPRQAIMQKGIGITALKRKCFAFLFSRLQLKASVGFHASTENEVLLMRKYFGQNIPVYMLEDLRDLVPAGVYKRNIREKTIAAGI